MAFSPAEHARRINNAWQMVLRHAANGDEAGKQEWLTTWQRLCNQYIADVEYENKEWMV